MRSNPKYVPGRIQKMILNLDGYIFYENQFDSIRRNPNRVFNLRLPTHTFLTSNWVGLKTLYRLIRIGIFGLSQIYYQPDLNQAILKTFFDWRRIGLNGVDRGPIQNLILIQSKKGSRSWSIHIFLKSIWTNPKKSQSSFQSETTNSNHSDLGLKTLFQVIHYGILRLSQIDFQPIWIKRDWKLFSELAHNRTQ